MIGLGIDVVDVDRAAAILASRHRVLDRLLTASERDYVLEMRHPARHLAVRLAAKEAVYKALQPLPKAAGVGWREIEIVRGERGRPEVRLHGLAQEIHAAHGAPRIHVSLTHSDRTAAAVALVESA